MAESRIKRALISVSDKAGVGDFASSLASLGAEIISTGGTARSLRESGLDVKDISDLTGFPEMMDGRVKTLHPIVHGGILHLRDNPQHLQQAAEHNILPIDLVCVNLYPFRQTVAKSDVKLEEAIENIDIGGPSMVRSAAKNYRDVVIVVDPADYSVVLEALRATGDIPIELRAELSAKAYQHTAAYDAAISNWMFSNVPMGEQERFRPNLVLGYNRVQSLRYGENPHQQAAFYADDNFNGISLASGRQLSGKELSFNNIMDMDAALQLVLEFSDEAACAIIKHTNPCGLSVRKNVADAFQAAREADPLSAFGGIIAFNQPVTRAAAALITGPQTFFEAIVAPSFDDDAIPVLTETKKWGANLRLVQVDISGGERDQINLRKVAGGILVQSADLEETTLAQLQVVSKRKPTQDELSELLFAWRAVKHVKSNAIVLSKDRTLIGVGAGQMNRVGSVKIAAEHAGERSNGSVLASDAFFPKPDGPETAAKAGVTAIIQPGGSVEDPNVIAVADQYGMAMVFTGKRHFRH